MRIRQTDERERLWQNLREATGHGHTSVALDDAARYYVKLVGGTPAQPTGLVDELLDAARASEHGLSEEQIAEILDTRELGLSVETTRHREITPPGSRDS